MSDEKFIFFWGGIYSNWYKAPFTERHILNSGRMTHSREWNCVEQYMMAAKAYMFEDMDSLNEILSTSNPYTQKKIGRRVKGFDRGAWEAVARDRVYPGVYSKFSQTDNLKKQLLSKRDKILVEASPTDKIWGVGLVENDPLIYDPENWQGTNWLGEVLMKVRDDLWNGKDNRFKSIEWSKNSNNLEGFYE